MMASAPVGRLIGAGRTAEVFELPDGHVLKLFHASVPVEWVDVDLRASVLVHAAGLPAPACYGLRVVGDRTGIVLGHVAGRPMTAVMRTEPWRITGEARRLARLQHAIAGVAAPGLPSGRERLLGLIRSAVDVPDDLRAAAVDALAGLPDGDALCHGDLHPDNVLLDAGHAVVIDWMTATRGAAAADVARTVLLMQVGSLPAGRRLDMAMVGLARSVVRSTYLRERLRLGDVTRRDVEAWMLPLAVARYGERIDPERPKLERVARGYLASMRT